MKSQNKTRRFAKLHLHTKLLSGGSAPAVRHHLPNRSADVIGRHDEFKKVLLIYQYLPSVVFL